jgi:hypothetical protein
MKELICKGMAFVGKTSRSPGGPKNCKAFVTWELEQGENGPVFSAQAEVWNHLQTNVVWCGQCLDDLLKLFPDNPTMKRVIAIWNQYHLNDMKAGLPEQEKAVEEIKKRIIQEMQSVPEEEHAFYDREKTQPNWHVVSRLLGADSYYSLMCRELGKPGLYEIPVPEGVTCAGGFPEEVLSGKHGYRYGERWIYSPIPQYVIEEIKSWTA